MPRDNIRDKILIDLGKKFDGALATASRAIAALPDDMPADDERAAFDAAIAPILAVADEIAAEWACSPAGALVQHRASMWMFGRTSNRRAWSRTAA